MREEEVAEKYSNSFIDRFLKKYSTAYIYMYAYDGASFTLRSRLFNSVDVYWVVYCCRYCFPLLSTPSCQSFGVFLCVRVCPVALMYYCLYLWLCGTLDYFSFLKMVLM